MKYPITAQRLKEAMEDNQIRAYELSDKTGVLKSSISHYMNGTHKMSNKTAGPIAQVLGVDPLWLMEFDVPKHKADDVGNSQQQKYYYDDATAKAAQELFDDENFRVLFDAAQNSKPEDLQMAADLLKRLKGTNPDG